MDEGMLNSANYIKLTYNYYFKKSIVLAKCSKFNLLSKISRYHLYMQYFSLRYKSMANLKNTLIRKFIKNIKTSARISCSVSVAHNLINSWPWVSAAQGSQCYQHTRLI